MRKRGFIDVDRLSVFARFSSPLKSGQGEK